MVGLSITTSQVRRIDLASQLVLTASGITRLLDGLERAGLVCKGTCESDARVTYAVLTEQGRALLARASADHTAAVAAVAIPAVLIPSVWMKRRRFI